MTFPHPDEIYKYIANSDKALTKRDLVRAFDIKGDGRITLKDILREMEGSGRILKGAGQAYSLPNSLAHITTIIVTEIDIDGDVFAKPMDWNEETQGPAPRIEILSKQPLKEGDRALARLKKYTPKLYEGRVIRRIDQERLTVIGEVAQTARSFILKPIDKRAKHDFEIHQNDLNGAQKGDLVVGEVLPSRGIKQRKLKVSEVIGNKNDVNAISIIALHEAGLHEHFLEKVTAETKGLKVPPLETKKFKREDLRDIPLVTIDGSDARDFDDAVFAEKTDDGFHLIVAIADVAHYVKHGSNLDYEAYKRGNSTYFPDRVVPMLPEALSNDLCSLRPHEDRASMGFHLYLDNAGNLTKYRVFRGLIRSHARLIYEQVQAAKDGVTDDMTTPLMDDVINPLYEAYAVLDKARQKRGALDLDLPERRIVIDDKGKMTGVEKRARLDAHKMIEEFMILANVAAAKALEAKNAPCVYRIHDRPSTEKLDGAREFLESFGLSLAKGGIAKPSQINQILTKAADMEYSQLISTVILRTQSQAIYSAENIGHFGLALERYGHFTSPIRRYADLLVHRSLIKAYKLGDGGLTDEEIVSLDERADHISKTERISSDAERSAVDRFTAAWMSERIGAEFTGKINGVTRFGIFVTLDENGADGLIPMRALPDDYYVHDEKQHALVGRKRGRIYRLGATMKVKLKEADGLTGSSIFEPANDKSADIEGIKFKKPPMGRDYKKDRKSKKKHYKDKKGGKKPFKPGFKNKSKKPKKK